MAHTQNLCSAFHPSKCTHTAVNTHPEQWAAIFAAAPGEQLGVWCVAQGSHLSRGIKGGRQRWSFTATAKTAPLKILNTFLNSLKMLKTVK